jgi:hypothetical protein
LTYSDQLILSTSGKIPSVWTETNASDVKITNRVNRLILKNANLLSSEDIENLCRSVATSGYILSVMTESDTADDTLVLKSVEKINIENSWDFWVEDGKPIGFDLLLVGWQTLQIQFGKRISNSELGMLSWHWVANLWRSSSSWIWVWHWLVQLRRSWAAWSTVKHATFSWAWRGGGLRRLRSITIWSWALSVATLERRLLLRRGSLKSGRRWRSRLGHLVLWWAMLI